MPSTVVLFRSPSTDSCSTALPDRYHHILSAHRYKPLFVPVLEQAYVGVAALKDVIRDGPQRWAGVVGTSKRAGESWCNAMNQLAEEGSGRKGKSKQSSGMAEVQGVPDWSTIPLYTPGSTTMSSFTSSSLPGIGPKAFPGAETTGSGSALGDFIVSHYSASSNPRNPLLILEGDKTISDLKVVLDSVGIPYQTRTVYETCVRPSLKDDISKLVDILDEEQPNEKIWLAFFSPSSAEPVIDVLRTKGHFPMEEVGNPRFDVIAIGKTTADFLRKIRVNVRATARTPTAQGLLDGILEAEPII